MSLRDHVICDSDLHVMEPPDLWERYIDPAYAHAAPRGLDEIPRDMRVKVKNHVMLRLGGVRPHARRRSQDRMARGARQRLRRRRKPRAGTRASQVAAMDAEGLDMAVLYPSRGLFVLGLDSVEQVGPDGLEPEYATAIARAYNDWMKDFCDVAPDSHVRRGHGRAARRRRRGRRGAPVRRGARLQGDLPRAGDGEPPTVAPPGVRPAVGGDRAPRRADRVPRRRADVPHARLQPRGPPRDDAVAHVQPAARHPVRHRVLLRRRHPPALPRPAGRAARGQLLVGAVVPVPPRRALRVGRVGTRRPSSR